MDNETGSEDEIAVFEEDPIEKARKLRERMLAYRQP